MSQQLIFSAQNEFSLANESRVRDWLYNVISSEGKTPGEIGYVFCDDDFLLELNKKYLDHDTYTDIISFDYSAENTIAGEIYISTERVFENAGKFAVPTEEELRRVLVHGILHLCGYQDKTEREKATMRQKENEKIELFHVEHSSEKKK